MSQRELRAQDFGVIDVPEVTIIRIVAVSENDRAACVVFQTDGGLHALGMVDLPELCLRGDGDEVRVWTIEDLSAIADCVVDDSFRMIK